MEFTRRLLGSQNELTQTVSANFVYFFLNIKAQSKKACAF